MDKKDWKKVWSSNLANGLYIYKFNWTNNVFQKQTVNSLSFCHLSQLIWIVKHILSKRGKSQLANRLKRDLMHVLCQSHCQKHLPKRNNYDIKWFFIIKKLTSFPARQHVFWCRDHPRVTHRLFDRQTGNGVVDETGRTCESIHLHAQLRMAEERLALEGAREWAWTGEHSTSSHVSS